MVDILDEIEIKIEYYDIYENDPLERNPRRSHVDSSEYNSTNFYKINSDDNSLAENQDADNPYDSQTDIQYPEGDTHIPQQSTESEKKILTRLMDEKLIKGDRPCNKTDENHEKSIAEDLILKRKSTIKNETMSWYKEMDKNGKLYCRFCSLSYSVIQTLRYHIRTKHPKEAVSLRAAIGNGNRSQKLVCHMCTLNFPSLGQLKKHVSVKHNIGNQDKYLCDYCQLLFYDKNTLDFHIEEKHIDSEDNFSKSIDEKVGRVHNPARKFPCPYCSHVAKRKYGLKTHIKAKHRSEEDLIFICPFCPYKAAIKYYLQNHLAKQHPESEYAQSKINHFCDVCGYRTPKKSHFIIHRRSHFCSIKKHKCEFCDYGTNLMANLVVHRRTHTKEKPFMCSIEGCEYRCGAKTALNSHKLKHDPDKYALYCDKCSYKTIYRHALKKHIDSHSRNTVLKTYSIDFGERKPKSVQLHS